MVEAFEAATMVADVVLPPPSTELIRTGAQLTDQVVELLVVRISRGLGPENCGSDISELLPVRIEVNRALSQERVPGDIWWLARHVVQLDIERPGERVDGEQIHSAIPDERGPGREPVQGPLQPRVRCLSPSRCAACAVCQRGSPR